MMRIAILGIGGVGGIVGAALAVSHPETYFCVRGENLNAINRYGLRVHSVLFGDFAAHPKLASDKAEDFGVMDAVIVSCKGYSLADACKAITPMVGPETVVIPLLNGVMVSDTMRPLLPKCSLADGTINVFSRLEKPGYIVHSTNMCSITFGMKDGSVPTVLIELVKIFNKSGLKTTLSDNILLDSWKKYALMCGTSAAFCYYGGPAGKVCSDPTYETVLRSIIGEITAVAAAKGIKLPDDTSDIFVSRFPKMPPDTMTSLYRDISTGKQLNKTELDNIIGRMVELGKDTSIPTPYHKAA